MILSPGSEASYRAIFHAPLFIGAWGMGYMMARNRELEELLAFVRKNGTLSGLSEWNRAALLGSGFVRVVSSDEGSVFAPGVVVLTMEGSELLEQLV